MNCNTDTVSISDMPAEVDNVVADEDAEIHNLEIRLMLAEAEGFDRDAAQLRLSLARLVAERKAA